jgi:multicomponent Na+:H+ antiporter subunit G
MNGVLEILASLLLLAGAALLLVAAWGVIRLPDALARQHAATKAGTLALAFVCLGAAGWAQDTGWAMRLLAILVFLLITLPVASHLLARAAVREDQAQADIDAAPRVDGPPGEA